MAGEDNGDIGGTLTPEAGTKLYVKFDKWGLTGTEKKSHLSKNLDGFTATTDFGFDWNDPAYHRSFWGKSVSYNSATPDLNIVTDREVKAAIKDPAYSMECTNIPNYIRKTANETSLIKPSLVTSAILTATVYEKDETAGTYTPVDLVLYNGVYYKKEQWMELLAVCGQAYSVDFSIEDFTAYQMQALIALGKAGQAVEKSGQN